MAAASAGFFVSLAGCSGDGDGNNTPEDGGDGDGGSDGTAADGEPEILDKAFVKPMNFDPTRKQWNPYSEVLQGQEISFATSELGGFHRPKGEYQARDIGKSYTHNGSTLELEIKDNYTWHNGKKVKIDDFLTGWRLNRHVYGNTGLWKFTDEIEKTGDFSCTFHFDGDINPNVALGQELITERLETPRWVFKEYLEALNDAQGDKTIPEAQETNAHQQAVADLRNFSWFMNDDSSPEVVRTGPFQPVEQTTSMIRYELYEDHPKTVFNDGKINFREVHQIGEDQTNPELWINDRADGRELGIPRPEDLPEAVRKKARINEVPLYQSNSMIVNAQRTDKHLDKRNVRKALQYVLSRPQITENLRAELPFSSSKAVGAPTGLLGWAAGDNPNEIWMGDTADNLTSYEKDDEKAAELLEEEGFSKDGGTWKDPDGETWTLSLIGTQQPEVKVTARTANDLLQKFGVKSELRLTSRAQGDNRYQNGEYDLIADLVGAGAPFPYAGYQLLWNQDEINQGIHVPSKSEFEVPPVGEPDAAPSETVDVLALLEDLASATDREESKEIITKLAWTWNQTVPALNLADRGLREVVMGDPEWGLPPDDHDTWNLHRFGVMWIFQLGTIEAL